jgi:hypothetical protein
LAAIAASSAFPFKQVAISGLSVLMRVFTAVIRSLILEIEAWHPESKITGAKATILAALPSSTHGTIVDGLGNPILVKNPFKPS